MIEQKEDATEFVVVEDGGSLLDSVLHIAFQVGLFFALLGLVLFVTWCTFTSSAPPAPHGKKSNWKYTPPEQRLAQEALEKKQRQKRVTHTPRARKPTFTTSIPHERRRTKR
jgi:hypothetical protein